MTIDPLDVLCATCDRRIDLHYYHRGRYCCYEPGGSITALDPTIEYAAVLRAGRQPSVELLRILKAKGHL